MGSGRRGGKNKALVKVKKPKTDVKNLRRSLCKQPQFESMSGTLEVEYIVAPDTSII